MDLLNESFSQCQRVFRDMCFKLIQGTIIKYVGGDPRVSEVVMKYFRHLLMVHEIFLKIFDRPQKIFLFAFFFIFFSNIFKNVMGVRAQNVQTT